MVLFPCFYSIVVTHRNCNLSIVFPLFHACFTRSWSHIGASILLGIILPSPHSFHRFSSRFNQFSKRSTQIVHCFPILFPLFHVIFPHFFHCFSHHFPLHCNLPKSSSPNCHLVHNPKKVYLGPPFLPPNFVIFDPLGALCPDPLNSLCSQKKLRLA